MRTQDVISSSSGCRPFSEIMTIEHLHHLLARCPSLPTGVCSTDTVRSLLAQLSEAEVSDDTAAVRALLSGLQERTRIPAKGLIFHEDGRPRYFGPLTGSSRAIETSRPVCGG